ncbi:MAG: hypothetical protein AAF221_04430 [Pseudomonadota bacterium]
MGQWRKLGQICGGLTIGNWAGGFAAVPTAVHLSGDVYRVYVSARDDKQRSRPAWIDVDIKALKVTNECAQPVLPLGDLGAFDDSGVMPTWITPRRDGDLMYYIGWNRGVTVPFRNSVGLAKQDERGTWNKLYQGPILDRTRDEPHFVASCAVMEDGDLFHNWYLSCTGWSAAESGPTHHYHIKYATSRDGVDWQRSGHVAIDFVGDEYAISRPSVLRGHDGSWHMWFSTRGDHYQIFKATSRNGSDWARTPDPVLTTSQSGWDAEMVCYPFVFEHAGKRFMFFNGNGYGQSGLGLAVWEGDLE